MANIPTAEAHRLLNESELVDGAKRDWKVGDRVEWDDSKNPSLGQPGICRGAITSLDEYCLHGGNGARVRPDEGHIVGLRSSWWWVPYGLLRPVSSAPAIAEKDRLHETGCVLCGESPRYRLGYNMATGKPINASERANAGCQVCSECGGDNERMAAADAEITRRKAIATNTQPPSIDWNKTCCECGNLRAAHLASCSRGKPVAKPDPYANHRESLGLTQADIAEKTADRDRIRGNRQREAFRMLDRGATRKYPYCESSRIFSTASYDSDP
jgi:hypothetical protein